MMLKAYINKKEDDINNPSLRILLEKNDVLKDKFRNNLLFKLMRSGKLSSPEKKERLLDYLHVWSVYFQKIMLLKTALCDNPAFMPLFNQHLDEEYGHDKILFQEKRSKDIKMDAILEAISNWFFSKILSFTPYEQIVMVNLCLEAASVVFSEYAIAILDPHKQSNYFQLHEGLDIDHEKMGIFLLENLTESHYTRLFEIQEISWQMMEALIKRIAELVISNNE